MPEDGSQNFPKSVTENLYKAPHARATSMEDAAASNLEDYVASSVQSELAPIRTESIRARVRFSDSSLMDQSGNSFEKPKSKESKGFRKLLKFGRKSHSSASDEVNVDSDGLIADNQTEAASSNDGKKVLTESFPNHLGANFHEMFEHKLDWNFRMVRFYISDTKR